MSVNVDHDRLVEPVEETPERRDRDLVSRLLGFAPSALLLILMARVTKHAADGLGNTDTWFHLRLGEEFLGGWSLRRPGQLTSFATSHWVATQWSTEMLTAKVDDWFGLPGVAWLYGCLYLALIVGVYFLCRMHGTALPAAVAAGVCVVAASASLSARPQVVSLILFTVTVAAWSRSARTRVPPWWLIPLTWVWATAHGLWTTGVIVGVVSVAGIALDQKLDRRQTLRLLSVPVLSVVAACLTPVGPALLTSQLTVGARTSMITEWGATSFREPTALLVACMIGVIVLRWGRRSPVGWTALFQLGVAVSWIVLVTRLVPFGAILAAPLFVSAVTELLPPQSRSGGDRGERVVIVGGAVACLVALAIAVPHTADRPVGVPTGFSTSLAGLPSGSVVIVEDGAGAWMEYAFPQVDPIIDGMLDAYPLDYISDFANLTAVGPGWADFVTSSRARVAVVLKDSSLASALRHQLGWQVQESDQDWVYLQSPASRP